MSNFFINIQSAAFNRQSARLQSVAVQAQVVRQSLIGEVTGFDNTTNEYVVTLPDGGLQKTRLGNFGAPPNQVSVITAKNSTQGFADFRAPQSNVTAITYG
jgi:hypothetical protein